MTVADSGCVYVCVRVCMRACLHVCVSFVFGEFSIQITILKGLKLNQEACSL